MQLWHPWEKKKINYQLPVTTSRIHNATYGYTYKNVQDCTRLHKIVQAFTCPFQPSRIVPTCPGRKPGMTYCDKLGDTSVISTTSLLQSADLWDVLWEPAWWEPATLVNLGHHIGHLWSPNQFSCLVNLDPAKLQFSPKFVTFCYSKGCSGSKWKQPSFLIARCLSLFIPVQSYLHSSYKALSRQLSLVTAWSRGMAEGKRIHRHVSERRVLPLNDLSFTRNESGPSTGARCHAPTQCQSKSSQQQQKQNLPNARFN